MRVARIDRHGAVDSVGTITARAVVIACGGYGQVFASTSNPPAVTGDGIAMALRAGLPVRDAEFVQFHPTVLWRGPEARGQQALVSEAVRGEGAILYDAAGARIMEGVHPQEDLAPRDVVSAAISARMAEAPGGVDDHVYLDATHMGAALRRAVSDDSRRVPRRSDSTRRPSGSRSPPPPTTAVAGSRPTLDGSTSLPGLFAVGEVTSTGVHGANRLASNSLTESIVAGTRVGRDLAWELPRARAASNPTSTTPRRRAVRPGPAPRGARRDVAPRRRDARTRRASRWRPGRSARSAGR